MNDMHIIYLNQTVRNREEKREVVAIKKLNKLLVHLGYIRYKGSKYLGKYRKLIQLRASQYIYNYVTIRLLTDRFSLIHSDVL